MNDLANEKRHQGATDGEAAAYFQILEAVQKIQPSAGSLSGGPTSFGVQLIINIDGKDQTVWVKVKAQRDAKRSGIMQTYYNGKYDVSVERLPGGQANFKSRKDGLPYDEIAQAVFDVTRHSLTVESNNLAAKNKHFQMSEAAVDLRQRYGFTYSKPWSVDSKPNGVEFNIQSTPEKIEQVLSILQEQGLL